MTLRQTLILISGLASIMQTAVSAGAWQDVPQNVPTASVEITSEAGGTHYRLMAGPGIVHVWQPADYRFSSAGAVIYVHGYFTSVDQAWSEDNLAAQFRASGRNALFIAPQAPGNIAEDVFWKSLPELFAAVEQGLGIEIPAGPLVVMAHSGGFRTILDWLDEPRVRWVVLLDGLYSGQAEFREWLMRGGGNAHHLVLVANDTHRACARFARRYRGVVRRRRIPPNGSGFTARERQARLFYLRSQYNHLAIVNSGKVIPVMLQLTSLKSPGEGEDLRKGISPRKGSRRDPRHTQRARPAIAPPA